MKPIKDSFKPIEDLKPIEDSFRELPSGFESASRGFIQGIGFDLADEIAGGLESAFTDKSYEQARDESREAFRLAREANPELYLGGELTGAIAPAIASYIGTAATAGGASPTAAATTANLARLAARAKSLAGGVTGLGKGATTALGRLTEGTIAGGLQGLGASEEEGIGAVTDTLLGAGTGLAIGGVLNNRALRNELLPPKVAEVATESVESISPKITDTVQDVTTKIEPPKMTPDVIEKSLGEMKSSAVETGKVSISAADDIIASMTGKNEGLINLLRKDPKQAKEILDILDTSKSVDDFANSMAEYMSADPSRKRAMSYAAQGEKLLDESGFLVDNTPIVKIISDVYDKVTKSGIGEISTSKTKAKQELERIFYEATKTDLYDARRIRTLLRDLDDQINTFGGYNNALEKAPAVRDALKRARGEINNFVKNQLPENIRGQYEDLYKKSSLEFRKSDILRKSLASKEASQLQGQDFGGDLGKATTVINQYLSKPNAANEAKVKRLSDIMSKDLGYNLLDELKKTRIKKQLDARGNQGSNIVNAWRGLKDTLPISNIPYVGEPISKLYAEPQLAVIGKRMETKGGDVAAKWAEYSGELMRQGKNPTQADAMQFLMREASGEMEPGIMQMLTKRAGGKPKVNIPEAQKIGLPDAEVPIPQAPVIIERVRGTKYADVLNRSLERGTRNFAVNHFLLQQTDPEYRKMTIEEQ